MHWTYQKSMLCATRSVPSKAWSRATIYTELKFGRVTRIWRKKKWYTTKKSHKLAKQHTWNWKEHNVVRSFVLINATVKSQLIYRRTAEIHGIPMLPFVYHPIQVYAHACTCKSVRACVCERQYTCTFRCCSLLSHSNVYFISDKPNEWTNERMNKRTNERSNALANGWES